MVFHCTDIFMDLSVSSKFQSREGSQPNGQTKGCVMDVSSQGNLISSRGYIWYTYLHFSLTPPQPCLCKMDGFIIWKVCLRPLATEGPSRTQRDVPPWFSLPLLSMHLIILVSFFGICLFIVHQIMENLVALFYIFSMQKSKTPVQAETGNCGYRSRIPGTDSGVHV